MACFIYCARVTGALPSSIMAASVAAAARASLAASRSNRSSVRHFRSLMARRHVRKVANVQQSAMPAMSDTRNYASTLADYSNDEVVELLVTGEYKAHNLEKVSLRLQRIITRFGSVTWHNPILAPLPCYLMCHCPSS
jgi:hypothetical protein